MSSSLLWIVFSLMCCLKTVTGADHSASKFATYNYLYIINFCHVCVIFVVEHVVTQYRQLQPLQTCPPLINNILPFEGRQARGNDNK